MKKILAIGGSNSSTSINKIFATYIANQLKEVEISILNWNDFVLPLYSPDIEKESGIPENALKFNDLIQETDAIVLSLAEYNGLHPAAFKNLWDWTSRHNVKFWADKPLFLAATSPGGRGGANVLRVTKELIPHFGGNVISEFSLPSFFDNFKDGDLVNNDLKSDLVQKITAFQKEI